MNYISETPVLYGIALLFVIILLLYQRNIKLKNTNINFRIKHIPNIGYFAQAKIKGQWQKIGAHTNNQFGLYEESSISHPLNSSTLATKRINEYKHFLKLLNQKPIYITAAKE